MKITCLQKRNSGLTMLEAVVVVFLVAILVAMLLPALAMRNRHPSRISCANNLKQIGLSFRLWAGDNNDKYPMAVSVTNGGAMEDVLAGNPMRVFQVMSNELSTPIILVCPEDKVRQRATNFDSVLTAKNVSYFINPDVKDGTSQGFMSGDDNLETNGIALRSGISVLPSNSVPAWTASRHKYSGNVVLADGSVQGIKNSTLKNWFASTNASPIRLAIP